MDNHCVICGAYLSDTGRMICEKCENLQHDDCPLFMVFGDKVDALADYLIAHGVTVQEWISVKDRLPEHSGKYLVCTIRGNVYQTKFYSYPEETGGHWGQKDKGRNITHWMPLPQPPKGD